MRPTGFEVNPDRSLITGVVHMPSDNNLHKAAHKGDLNEIKMYIEAEVSSDDYIDVNEPGAGDRRALHRAAGGGHIDITLYLLEKGAILDQPDKSGRTALHWAIISDFPEVVKLLISKGADIFLETTNKCSSLHFACEKGSVEIVRILMDIVKTDEEKRNRLTQAKNSEEMTPFAIAAKNKNAPICQALKDSGDTNANGASGACIIA